MSARWPVWQSELERISPFSEEWDEGVAEEFIHSFLCIVAKKRAQREAVAKLAEELKCLRAAFTQTLAFFDFERNCQSWSAANCPGGEAERVLNVLGQWRANLLQYKGMFPPSEEKTRTYVALHECCLEAEAAMSAIRPGFGTLHGLLAQQAPVAESPEQQPSPEPTAALPEAGEPEAGEAAAEAACAAV